MSRKKSVSDVKTAAATGVTKPKELIHCGAGQTVNPDDVTTSGPIRVGQTRKHPTTGEHVIILGPIDLATKGEQTWYCHIVGTSYKRERTFKV